MSESLNPHDCRTSGDRYRLLEAIEAQQRIERARQLAFARKCRAEGRVPIAKFAREAPERAGPAPLIERALSRVLRALGDLLEGVA